MKTPIRVNKEIEQRRIERIAIEELLQHRLESRNIEKERMRREIEARLTAKVDAIAQEWVEYDLRQAQMVLTKEARKERLVETKILKEARAIRREVRNQLREGM